MVSFSTRNVAKLDRSDLAVLMAHRKTLTRGNPGKRRLIRPKTPAYPLRWVQAYRNLNKSFVDKIRSLIERTLIPNLEVIFAQNNRHTPAGAIRSDDFNDDVQKLLDQIRLELEGETDDEELVRNLMLLAKGVSDLNRRNVLGSVKDVLNVDITLNEPYLDNFLALFARQNAELVSNITDDAIDKVAGIIYNGFRDGRRAESLTDDIMKAMDTTESRANFVARDQVGKLNGQLDRLRQTELGVNRYTWRTMEDDRVRETHEENDGEVFSWDDPPVETGHPGEDYYCRCWAEPVFEDLLDQGTGENEEA